MRAIPLRTEIQVSEKRLAWRLGLGLGLGLGLAWSLPRPRGLLDIGTTNLAVSVQIGETAFQRVPIPLATAIG